MVGGALSLSGAHAGVVASRCSIVAVATCVGLVTQSLHTFTVLTTSIRGAQAAG